jgi:glycosyl transferase family 25
MQIFVINLAGEVARRAWISNQLNVAGLSFEIVGGVNGAALSGQEIAERYSDRKAKWRASRSLVAAEIGCALSHLKVYGEIIARDIPCALVLEDDVVLPADLSRVLDACAHMLDPKRAEVWLLSEANCNARVATTRFVDEGHMLCPYVSGYFASSYILTAAAAQALVAELYPIGDVADCWQRLRRYGVVDVYVLVPPLIHQDQAKFGSSTTTDHRKYMRWTLCEKVIYKWRRARTLLWDVFYAPYRRLCKRNNWLRQWRFN